MNIREALQTNGSVTNKSTCLFSTYCYMQTKQPSLNLFLKTRPMKARFTLLTSDINLARTCQGIEKETAMPVHHHSSEQPWEGVACQGSLGHTSCKGQHSQTAILQLCQAHLLLTLLIQGVLHTLPLKSLEQIIWD